MLCLLIGFGRSCELAAPRWEIERPEWGPRRSREGDIGPTWFLVLARIDHPTGARRTGEGSTTCPADRLTDPHTVVRDRSENRGEKSPPVGNEAD